jgi:hypothetical protein
VSLSPPLVLRPLLFVSSGVPVSTEPGYVCREAAVIVWLAECSRQLRFGEGGY